MTDSVLDVKELLEPEEYDTSVSDSVRSKSGKKKKEAKKKSIAQWGFPGHLTKEEGDVYVSCSSGVVVVVYCTIELN